jgi:hypothetical protein
MPFCEEFFVMFLIGIRITVLTIDFFTVAYNFKSLQQKNAPQPKPGRRFMFV